MDPRKWMAGGPDPEPEDLDEELETGTVVVEHLEPNANARIRGVTNDEADRIRLKPVDDRQA